MLAELIHPAAVAVSAFCFGMTAGWTLRHRLRPRRAILCALMDGDNEGDIFVMATDGPMAGMRLELEQPGEPDES